MKLCFFLITLFALYYVAVMYESHALMVLSLAGIVVLLLLVSSLLYGMKHISVSFVQDDKPMYCRMNGERQLQVTNTGVLPVLHMLVLLKYGKEKQWFVTDGAEETATAVFSFRPRHCGLLRVSIEKVKVYDWFSLFALKKRCKETADVIVMPQVFILFLPAVKDSSGEQDNHVTVGHSGYEENDLKDLHMYRDGDKIRRIHWKLYARSDELWVKDMEKYVDEEISVGIDLSSHKADDVFYTLLYALLLGMIRSSHVVHVICMSDTPYTCTIAKEEDVIRLFASLYEMAEKKVVFLPVEKNVDYVIDGNLSIRRHGEIIRQFNKRTIWKELRKETALWKSAHA